MKNIAGALIRRERLLRNYSQEGLCRGICSVSYLSKIENHQADPGEDIMRLLFERLGITYEQDPTWLARAQSIVEGMYDMLLYGVGNEKDCYEEFFKEYSRFMYSPYTVDALIFTMLWKNEYDGLLEEFQPCMTLRQKSFYIYGRYMYDKKLNEEDKETYREFLENSRQSRFLLSLAQEMYCFGHYSHAVESYIRSYDLAAEEASASGMLEAVSMLGNCYACILDLKRMTECYAKTIRLARSLGRTHIIQISYYNMGASYLEVGDCQQALEYLEKSDLKEPLYYHKLAACYEKLGKTRAGQSGAQKGSVLVKQDEKAYTGMEIMYAPVAYRLEHKDYIYHEAYAVLMKKCMDFLEKSPDHAMGHLRFHAPYMIEVLEKQRKYREIYMLMKKIS